MAITITIDGVGRLVIPKAVRERFRLTEGSRLHLIEEDGRMVLTPESPAPRLIESGGLLVLELGHHLEHAPDHLQEREGRLRSRVGYALQR